MPELAAMKRLRDKQAERLAKAIADNESNAVIARAKKLLDDIDADLKLYSGIKKSLALNAARR
jgi:hypothetical protein